MSDIQSNPVYSKNVFEFITVANDFRLFIAKVDTYSKNDILAYLQKVCPLLYLKGFLLPDVEVSNPEANMRFFTELQWEETFNEIRNKLQPDDEFWYIDSGDIHENETKKGSLAEHLTDVYQDLSDFLTLFQKNSLDAKENAVYELKTNFLPGWGLRLVNAMKAMHYISLKGLPEDDNPAFDFLSI